MSLNEDRSLNFSPNDFMSGLVVFLVAVPLCLGIALASGTPLFSGLLAGIIGGILVGAISGSQTSVSAPQLDRRPWWLRKSFRSVPSRRFY